MAHWLLLCALAASYVAAAYGCGGQLTGYGTFSSPNYPSNYPSSQSCSWVITAEAGKVVYLTFTAFELEAGSTCTYDSVKVYNGPSSSSPALGSFCGNAIPAAITGGSAITVVFKSDSSLEYKGFSASFQSVATGSVPTTPKPAGSCGDDFVASSGTVTSPNHPNLYPNSASCVYTITVPSSKVVLTFSAVDIESSSSCTYDYLEVRDGSASGTLLNKVCGNALPGKIIASGSRLHLKFVSDSSVQKTGFRASWEELTCASKGGACSASCEGKVDRTLPCSSTGSVCCFPKIQEGACGIVQSNRIVNGNESKPHAWPWQVSLQQSSNGFHFCGGSIISPLWVITAAHCVDGTAASAMQVVVGEHHLKEVNEEQVLRVANYYKHENYNGNAAGFPNDIALIRLATPIEINRYALPACLPQPMEEFSGWAWITGWGKNGTAYPDVLNQLLAELVSRGDCRAKWGSQYINEGHQCIGDGLKGACNGDSGGPMVVERDEDGLKKFFLIGATSWGRTGCQTEGFPSVYTRISYFVNWIEDKIRSSMYEQN